MISRVRAHQILEHPARADRTSWVLEICLITLILASVTAVALETVPSFYTAWRPQFRAFDAIVTAIFTLEYAARIWAAPEGEPNLPPTRARLRYLRSPMAIIDFIAIVPFYLTLVSRWISNCCACCACFGYTSSRATPQRYLS